MAATTPITFNRLVKGGVTLADFLDAENIKPLREWATERLVEEYAFLTPVELENIGSICYQNVIFSTLLHYPLFLNFLAAYEGAPGHIDKKGVCAGRKVAFDEEDGTLDCRLCLFLKMARAYWDENKKQLGEQHKKLSKRCLNDWKGGKNRGSEQDTEEFYLEFIRQCEEDVNNDRGKPKNDPDGTIQAQKNDALQNVFQMRQALVRECRTAEDPDPEGSCAAEYREQDDYVVRVAIDAAKLQESAEEVITKFFEFSDSDHHPKCGGCNTNVIYERLTLREPPEILVVNVNRMQLIEGETAKAETRMLFGKNLRLTRKAFANSGEGGDGGEGGEGGGGEGGEGGEGDKKDKKDKDDDAVDYKLFSAVMHYGAGDGEAEVSGHYTVLTKGGANAWTNVGDGGVEEIKKPRKFMKEDKYQRAVQMLVYHRTQVDPQMALEITKNKEGFVEGIRPITPSPGETTVTFFGPDNVKVIRRVITEGVPWNAAGERFAMDRPNLPTDSPLGVLTIGYKNSRGNIVESYTISGRLQNNLDKQFKGGKPKHLIRNAGEGDDDDDDSSDDDDDDTDTKHKDKKASEDLDKREKALAEREKDLDTKEKKLKADKKVMKDDWDALSKVVKENQDTLELAAWKEDAQKREAKRDEADAEREKEEERKAAAAKRRREPTVQEAKEMESGISEFCEAGEEINDLLAKFEDGIKETKYQAKDDENFKKLVTYHARWDKITSLVKKISQTVGEIAGLRNHRLDLADQFLSLWENIEGVGPMIEATYPELKTDVAEQVYKRFEEKMLGYIKKYAPEILTAEGDRDTNWLKKRTKLARGEDIEWPETKEEKKKSAGKTLAEMRELEAQVLEQCDYTMKTLEDIIGGENPPDLVKKAEDLLSQARETRSFNEDASKEFEDMLEKTKEPPHGHGMTEEDATKMCDLALEVLRRIRRIEGVLRSDDFSDFFEIEKMTDEEREKLKEQSSEETFERMKTFLQGMIPDLVTVTKKPSPPKATGGGVQKPGTAPARVGDAPKKSKSPTAAAPAPAGGKERPGHFRRVVNRVKEPFMDDEKKAALKAERMAREVEKQNADRRKQEEKAEAARKKEQAKTEAEEARRKKKEEKEEGGGRGAAYGGRGGKGNGKTEEVAERIIEQVRSERSTSIRNASADNKKLESVEKKIEKKSREKDRQRKGGIGKGGQK